MNKKKILIVIFLVGIVGIPVMYWQAGEYEKTSRLLIWSIKMNQECVNGNAQSCKQAVALNQTLEYYLSKLIYPLPNRIRATEGYQQWEILKLQAAESLPTIDEIQRQQSESTEAAETEQPAAADAPQASKKSL